MIACESRAVGRIAWLTSKGAFGKSGKMDTELEHVEVSGPDCVERHLSRGRRATRWTPSEGSSLPGFRGFITGRGGTIPPGRELVAITKRDLEVDVHASAVQSAPLSVAAQVPRAAPKRNRRRPSTSEGLLPFTSTQLTNSVMGMRQRRSAKL